MKIFKMGLGKYIFLIVFALLYNCVSSGKYESLQKEKTKNEEITNKQIIEYEEKIKLQAEELELLKEECQPTTPNATKRKPHSEDEKLRKLRELKRKNGN